MHFGRMRTARSSTVPGSLRDRDPPPRDRYIPWTETTPPPNRMTDRCKNITFPQLSLRTVTNQSEFRKTGTTVSKRLVTVTRIVQGVHT